MKKITAMFPFQDSGRWKKIVGHEKNNFHLDLTSSNNNFEENDPEASSFQIQTLASNYEGHPYIRKH